MGINVRTAAVAGIGIVQLPAMLVREQLRSSALERLLADWAPRREVIHAVFPSPRGLLPSVRALIDSFAAQFEPVDAD